METRPCQIVEFFNGTKQLVIPLFQRSYEWAEREWEMLWDDIMEQYERPEHELVSSHFTGAIVTAPAKSVPVGVSKSLVIDGQQRLTTIAALICALRAEHPLDSPKFRKLNRLLINEDESDLDYYKILPTQHDRPAFFQLLAQDITLQGQISRAFDFFRKKLLTSDSSGEPINADRLLETLQSRVTVVSIHLGEFDDPYLIFESLNAKGSPLTQADLIRNYLLLRISVGDQTRAYEKYWLPMQAQLSEHLTEFMRQFLMSSGEDVSKSSIYSVLKKRLASPTLDVVAFLAELERASTLYAQIIGLVPLEGPIGDRLVRLRHWDVATANPFILKLLDLLSNQRTFVEDVVACLDVIESFVVRRIICGVPTNQLKRIFLSAAKDMPIELAVAPWLKRFLSGGGSGRRWPDDQEFKEGLSRYKMYSQLSRCKFVLESIEGFHVHKEPVNFQTSTIEHIMPRTLTDEWRTMLGPDCDVIHGRWLDVLANLTLTGYNSELSNAPFAKKRQLFEKSHFEMNRWIAARESWGERELIERSNLLFECACRIWVGPSGA